MPTLQAQTDMIARLLLEGAWVFGLTLIFWFREYLPLPSNSSGVCASPMTKENMVHADADEVRHIVPAMNTPTGHTIIAD